MGYRLTVVLLKHKENISLSHVPSKHDWLADAAYEYIDNYPFSEKKFSTRSGGATADLVLNTAPKKVRQLPFAEIYTEKQGKDLLKRLEESHPSWKKHTKKVSGKAPHGYLVSLF